MRLLIYADLHLRDGSELCNTIPGQLLQHYRARRFFSDLKKIYTEYQCNALVDLGDTTDDRTSLSLLTLNCLGECLRMLPEGRRWKLIGNHEQYLRNSEINTRPIYEPWFKVIEKHEIVADPGCTLVFASYPANHKDLADWLFATAKKVSGPKILLGHFEVKGAYVPNGQLLDGVPAEVLADYQYVILGHIHLPQNMDRIYYVGPPFQQNFGEGSQRNRVAIVDTKTLSLEFVYLKGYPEYKKVSLEEFKKINEQLPTEDRYKVVLTSQEETNTFFSLTNNLHAIAEYSYKDSENPEVNPEAPTDWSFESAFKRYTEKYPPASYGIKIDPAEILDTAKMLVEK
jgi:hypothetical protein